MANGAIQYVNAEHQSTDATAYTWKKFDLASDETVYARFQVIGRKDDGAKVYMYDDEVCFENTSGTVSELTMSASANSGSKGVHTYVVSTNISSTKVAFTVAGAAGETVDWNMYMEAHILSA